MRTQQEIEEELRRREKALEMWENADKSPMRTHMINIICEGIEALKWVLKQ